jgi:hypothetical protein
METSLLIILLIAVFIIGALLFINRHHANNAKWWEKQFMGVNEQLRQMELYNVNLTARSSAAKRALAVYLAVPSKFVKGVPADQQIARRKAAKAELCRTVNAL